MRGELKLVAAGLKADLNAPSPGHQDLIGAVSARRGDPTLRWLSQFANELSDAAILVDGMGKRVIDTSAALLGADVERPLLEHRIGRCIARLAEELQRRGRRGVLDELSTRSGRYRFRGMVVPDLGGVTGAFALLAVDRMSARPPDIEAARSAFALTAREGEISLLLAQRLTTTEIAVRLGISSHTVRRHTENIFRKLGVRSRADVMTALQNSASPQAKL